MLVGDRVEATRHVGRQVLMDEAAPADKQKSNLTLVVALYVDECGAIGPVEGVERRLIKSTRAQFFHVSNSVLSFSEASRPRRDSR